jgi:hypothetical protein
MPPRIYQNHNAIFKSKFYSFRQDFGEFIVRRTVLPLRQALVAPLPILLWQSETKPESEAFGQHSGY